MASRLDERGTFWPIVTGREAGCDGRNGDAREFFVRTNGADADAKSCGPGLPTLRLSEREVISPAMGANKPGPQGEHEGHR